jgi:hypothetical protein
MDEILKLLKENNEMLKEILVFLRYFQENDDMRQFKYKRCSRPFCRNA